MKKRKRIGFCIKLALCLILSGHLAAVKVDIYQYMGFGQPGTRVTEEQMRSASVGGITGLPLPDWHVISGDPSHPDHGVWVSSNNVKTLPGVVSVGGSTLQGLMAYSWAVYYKWQRNYVHIAFGNDRVNSYAPYHDRMTVACFFTPGPWFPSSALYLDTIGMSGTTTYNGQSPQYNYGVFSVQNGNDAEHVGVRVHTEQGSGEAICLQVGHTYWVNLHYDGPGGKARVMAFDPEEDWMPVGTVSELEFQSVANPLHSQVRSWVKIGRYDTHANYSSETNPQDYFSHLMIDFSEAKFPLLPDLNPTLVLTSPNGDEVWRRGEQRIITWTASGIEGDLVIELLQNDVVVGTIAASVDAAAGSYTWSVGRLENGSFVGGSNLKIRISTAAGAVVAEQEIR